MRAKIEDKHGKGKENLLTINYNDNPLGGDSMKILFMKQFLCAPHNYDAHP